MSKNDTDYIRIEPITFKLLKTKLNILKYNRRSASDIVTSRLDD